MTTLLERIDARVSAKCRAKTCRKEGCTLKLTGLPHRRRLIDMDHPYAPGRPREERCDYLYFAEDDGRGWVVPLELKGGPARASKIAAQLRAGARVAERLVGADGVLEFMPVAARGRMHRQQVNSLAQPKNQVTFRRREYNVELLKCGAPLIVALRRRRAP